MKNRKKSEQNGVFAAIRMAAGAHPVLTAGTLLCVAGSVGASLVPPLLLAGIGELLDSQQGEAADHQDTPGVCADQGQQEQVGDAFVGLQGVQTDVEVLRGEAA